MIANARPKSLYGKRGVVVSGHHLATLHAQQVLQSGGTLVDAMISASATLTVALPHASSLGGCAMMLYYDAASARMHALNGSGRAPLAAELPLFAAGMPQRGLRATVVPTLVRLWARAHERFGRMPLASLLTPSVELADQGIPAAEELVRNLALADSKVLTQPGFSQAMLSKGTRMKAGELMLQKQLASVLSDIGEGGEKAFYDGAAAHRLIQFSRSNDGLFAQADFDLAQADWVQPWSAPIGVRSVHVMPPNSVGVLMLQQLVRWEHAHRPAGLQDVAASVNTAISVIAEGRSRIGDPQRTPFTPAQLGLDQLDANTATDEHMQAFRQSRAGVGDTTGFVAMDANGNALAMLQSVFQPFGCGAIDPDTGILLNNRMFDFSTKVGDVNMVGPGARPSHTLNPWMVLDTHGVHLAGISPGGVSQTTTGYQMVTGALDSNATLGELVSRPRWSLSRDGTVLLEPGMPAQVAQQLRSQGLQVEENSQHEFYFGSVKVVRRQSTGWLEAAADIRRQAVAMAW